MSSILRTLLALLLCSSIAGAMAQTPQPADCNICSCPTVGGLLGGAPAGTSGICTPVVLASIPANFSNLRFWTVAGNRYRVSLCGLGAGVNTILYIRDALAPYTTIPGACDDDGCGLPGGPSSVEFTATATSHRLYVYDGNNLPCGLLLHPIWTNQVRIECLGPNPVPSNDEPCGAIPIPLATTSCVSPIPGTTTGASATTLDGLGAGGLYPPTGCGAVGYSGNDVWYSTTVPATGLIGIEVQESGICATGIGLYTAPTCSPGPFNWITGTTVFGVCSIDGISGPGSETAAVFNPTSYGLVPGQTVYIRVWERNNNENGNFTICAYNAQPPPNDDPCGAIVLNPSDPCVPVEYNTVNAQGIPPGLTVGAMSCGPPVPPGATSNPIVRDVWFRVTVPATGAMTVNTVAGTLTDMAMSWYRPTAGTVCPPYTASLTQIGCNDNQSGTNAMPRINSTTYPIALTPGETIYIRVWNRIPAEFNYHGTFSICVSPNTPPPNDDPCGAIALDVNIDCVSIGATLENATNTGAAFLPGASTAAAPSCGGATNGDVWYTIAVPGDLPAPYGLEIFTDNAGAATPPDLATAVYRDISGTGCPVQLQLVQVPGACNVSGDITGGPVNVPTITPGELLYVRVWRQTATQGTFSICVRRTDPVLCAGTYYDSGGPNGPYQNNENINSVGQSLFCPHKAGDVVTLTFNQFNIEAGWDFMRIYNGTSTAAPLLGVFTGTNGPGTISANLTGNPSGCLYVTFTSDGIITAPGYAFKVSCAPPGAGGAGSLGACGTTVFDPGGSGSAYPGNLGVASTGILPFMATYCPYNGNAVVDSVITITFNSFDVEDNFDALYVFNDEIAPGTPLNTPAVLATQFNSGSGAQLTWSGPYNPPVPPNGGYWGTAAGPFTATVTAANPNGCITIALYTDAIVAGNWVASLSCGPPPPPLPPPVGDCNILFYETPAPGGATGNYGNNVTSTQTLCAQPGQLLTVTFQQFNLENTWDKMYVFDGPNTASPMIASGNGPGNGPAPFGAGGYWGTGIPGPFTASTPGGCLTFVFSSDASVVRPGWVARTACAPQAPNDNPCTPVGATLVNVNTTCIPQTFNNSATTPTAGVPAPGCGSYQGGDVWYRFVAPPSGRVLIDAHAGTLSDGVMALYSAAACAGPFTLIECNDDGGEGLMPQIDRMCNPLTPGNTYWLRFYGYAGQIGDYELCIISGGAQTSLQTDCGGAFSLCNDAPFTASAYGAGCDNDLIPANWGCLTNGEHQGSWYAFRVANSGSVGMSISTSVPADVDWAIWQAPSVSLPNPVGANCLPSSPPIRCSYASQYNTINTPVVNGNPTAATGMGRATFGGAPSFLAPGAVQNDATDGWVPGIGSAAGAVYLMFVDDHHLMGEPYTVSWTTTPTVPGNEVLDCTLLPVGLVDLEAKPRITVVDLLWTTSTEQNSSHFLVERSMDGRDFEVIGSVDAMGTRSIPTDYQFPDQNPHMGMNYYRLRMVDIDGTFAYSNVVTALFEPNEVQLMVVPNPTRDRADLVLSSIHDDVLHVRILDGSGRLVTSFSSPSGAQRIELPIQKLEAGSYTLQLLTREGSTFGRTRFVKQ